MSKVETLLARMREAREKVEGPLLAERERLIAELATVDAALAEVRGARIRHVVPDSAPKSPRKCRRVDGETTVVDTLLGYLAGNPGSRWSEIRDATNINASYLGFLAKTGRIVRSGSFGHYRYSLPDSEAAE